MKNGFHSLFCRFCTCQKEYSTASISLTEYKNASCWNPIRHFPLAQQTNTHTFILTCINRRYRRKKILLNIILNMFCAYTENGAIQYLRMIQKTYLLLMQTPISSRYTISCGENWTVFRIEYIEIDRVWIYTHSMDSDLFGTNCFVVFNLSLE